MKQYLDCMQYVLDHGYLKPSRTGVDVLSVFGMHMRFDLTAGFPAVTTKTLAWRAMCSELLWFLEGSTDERRLCEILHGSRDPNLTTIWTNNANSPEWITQARFEGDLGFIYGYQWRSWRVSDSNESVDQIKNLIDGLTNDPYGRRHVLTAWNPGDLSNMALPPCHMLSQFNVTDGKLSCSMVQRSVDLPLGCPFNIASYALLTHMIAQVCGLKVGELIYTLNDAHIYVNQIEGVKEQLSREPQRLPTLWVNPEINSIDSFTMNDIELRDYHPLGKINFPFST